MLALLSVGCCAEKAARYTKYRVATFIVASLRLTIFLFLGHLEASVELYEVLAGVSGANE